MKDGQELHSKINLIINADTNKRNEWRPLRNRAFIRCVSEERDINEEADKDKASLGSSDDSKDGAVAAETVSSTKDVQVHNSRELTDEERSEIDKWRIRLSVLDKDYVPKGWEKMEMDDIIDFLELPNLGDNLDLVCVV